MAVVGDDTDRAGTRNRPSRTLASLDRLFLLAIGVGLLATAFVVAAGIHGHAIVPALDLALDTTALIVCVVLTTLAWARFRERRVVAAAYHAAAFMALSVAYGIGVIASLQEGGSLASPENAQVLVFSVSRLGAATLFVLAGVFTRRPTYGMNPVWILVTPTLAVLIATLVGRSFGPPPDVLQILGYDDPSGLPHITPFGAAIHLVTAALFFVGAHVSRRLWHTGRSIVDGWVAIGLLFAGFAEVHWVLFPSDHPGQVSTADLLLLACSVCLIAGLASAFRDSLRDLRQANTRLEQLRDAEVEHAALEERTRLARELHDGLAQDLWLAKLRIGELASMDDLSVEARRATESVGAAIDIGLGEARGAVAALRSPGYADSGFCTLVRRTVEDYGDRFGLRVEFTFEGEHATRIAPRTQAEILRITQEALANVARHADASLVGVRLAIRDDRISLRVADNGRGFEVATTGREGFGLISMRQRAALIGGRIRIASKPEAGTRIMLTAPLARPAGLVEAEQR